MENDPFLRAGAKPQAQGPNWIGFFVCYGIICAAFGICLDLFAKVYYHSPLVSWSFALLCVGSGILSVQMSKSLYLRAYGGLLIFSAILGTTSGLYIYESHMAAYYAYDESREFTNVLPSEPAASVMDAGKLVFAAEARVETTQSIGYKHGDTYCVAPIKDTGSGTRVEFWAVCLNKCEARRDFRCDDVADPAARGAVVLADPSTFFPSQMLHYQQAVKQAEAAFDIVSATEPLFVRWVKDPDAFQQALLATATGQSAFFVIVYFLAILPAWFGLYTACERAQPK